MQLSRRPVRFSLFLFTLLCLNVFSSSDIILVRPTKGDSLAPSPADMAVSQGNQALKFSQWTREYATLSSTDSLVPKTVIIELSAPDYSAGARQFIGRLISDFTQAEDRVLLVDRDKIQAYVVGTDKLALLDVLHTRLQVQARSYGQKISTLKQRLDKDIARVSTALSEGDIYSIPLFTEVLSFLQTAPGFIASHLREEAFISPSRIQQTFRSLTLPPGERWWFRILDLKVFSSLARIPDLSARIRRFMSSLTLAATAMSTALGNLEKACEPSQYLDSPHLEKQLLSHNCRPIVLLDMQEGQTVQSQGGYGVFMALINLNRQFSDQCGGFSENLSRQEALSALLTGHGDLYWKLYSPDRHIRTDLPLEISDNALCVALMHTGHNSLNVQDETGPNNSCTVSIEGFGTLPGHKSGLLTVRLALYAPSGEAVFNSRRTLLTDNPIVRISIPISSMESSAPNKMLEVYDHHGMEHRVILNGPLFDIHGKK